MRSHWFITASKSAFLLVVGASLGAFIHKKYNDFAERAYFSIINAQIVGNGEQARRELMTPDVQRFLETIPSRCSVQLMNHDLTRSDAFDLVYPLAYTELSVSGERLIKISQYALSTEPVTTTLGVIFESRKPRDLAQLVARVRDYNTVQDIWRVRCGVARLILDRKRRTSGLQD